MPVARAPHLYSLLFHSDELVCDDPPSAVAKVRAALTTTVALDDPPRREVRPTAAEHPKL